MTTPAAETEARARLGELAPELAHETLRRATMGAQKNVWLIGEEHVLRHAPNAHVLDGVRRERIVLAAIAGKTSVPTPVFLVASEDEAWDVCRMAPGKPLDWQQWGALSEEARLLNVEALGRFVASLHSALSAEQAGSLGIPPLELDFNERPEWLREALAGALVQPSHRQLLERVLEIAPALTASCTDPVLLHDDLSHHNIGYAPDGKMVGVFDFGGTGLGDRHRDLRYDPGIDAGDDRLVRTYEDASQVVISRSRQRAWHALSALANLGYSLGNEGEALQAARWGWVDSVAQWDPSSYAAD